MAKLENFIFPKKYISHLPQAEKREGILNEETLPMGFRPTQPLVFFVNVWRKSLAGCGLFSACDIFLDRC